MLPKTRSGKIMRRILRKIAENEYGALGDTSTLADPAVVTDLIGNRQNRGKGEAASETARRSQSNTRSSSRGAKRRGDP
jgi:hypothetical protein